MLEATIAYKPYDRPAIEFFGYTMRIRSKRETYCIDGYRTMGTLILPSTNHFIP